MAEEIARRLILYEVAKPELPDASDVPLRVHELLKRSFEGLNFDKEKEIASRLTELSLKRNKTFDPDPVPLVQDNHSSQYSPAMSANEPVVVKGMPVTSTSASPVYATAVATAYGASSAPSHSELIDKMMTETKESRELCEGYLDMMNWDYDAALKLYIEVSK